ncbi:hypothetical protein C2845_PM01G39360 [Panicum miliaceum]|uniref:Uncharacterized protein n=1 Tax=Panicum miliaceum TaxID=4540 RepID=A0A3L6THQ7_PANMI|nr:hypothetical protein C2845_PM01G39360 [Panicum miliaceum]
MPARMSELKHPPSQQTLYTATRARGAMPRVVPAANLNRLVSGTAAPAAVEDVCVSWLSSAAYHQRHLPRGYLTDAVISNTVEELEPTGLAMLRRTLGKVPVWPIGPLVRTVSQIETYSDDGVVREISSCAGWTRGSRRPCCTSRSGRRTPSTRARHAASAGVSRAEKPCRTVS